MKIILAVVVILVAIVGWNVFANGIPYQTGSGEHTGYVSAVEKVGLIFKTGTAYIKTDPQSSQEDNYCVEDANVYNQLVSASENRQLITVEYENKLIMGFAHCNGEKGIITSVSVNK